MVAVGGDKPGICSPPPPGGVGKVKGEKVVDAPQIKIVKYTFTINIFFYHEFSGMVNKHNFQRLKFKFVSKFSGCPSPLENLLLPLSKQYSRSP
jgi:hypothetical protein